ncbi:MAG: nucleotide exchange factor GrpE [Chloroflexota bacterium]
MTDDEKQEQVAESAPESMNELEDLRLKLAQAETRSEEFFGNWQRAAADLSNFRKRVDQERSDLQKFAASDVLSEILVILDDWERALIALPPEMMKFTWIQGSVQIYQKMQWSVSRHGVTPIDATDQPFDPHLHDAVMRDEDVPTEEQTHVVQELQRGYKLHDRVLRPSLVKVGRPPELPAATDESTIQVDEAVQSTEQ